MKLSNLLYGLEHMARGFAFESARAPATAVGDVTLTFKGAANDLAEAHNDAAYRPHLVGRRDERRRRRDVRTA